MYITERLSGRWLRQRCKHGTTTPPPPKHVSTTTTTTRSDYTGTRTRYDIIIIRLRSRRSARHRLGCAPRSSPGAVHAAAATTAMYCHTDSAALLLRTLPRSEGIYTMILPTVHTRIRSETTQSDSPRHPVEYPPSSLFRFLFSLASDPIKPNYIRLSDSTYTRYTTVGGYIS